MKLKHLRKACKKVKRKYVTPWKTFGIVFLILTLILTPMCLAVKLADNAIAAWTGEKLWELENPDENAQYFKPDALSIRELSRQVALEGITLLKNENNVLPLKVGTGISLFGADLLKTALEAQGFTVTPDGDTAITVWDGNADTLRQLADRKQSGSLKTLIILLTDGDVSFLKNDFYQADAILWVGESELDSALAELLSGKANPSGRLPVSIGAYPFGYGLSYTSFAYSDFAVALDETTGKLTATVTVTNTGKVPGKETAQIYSQAADTVTLVGFGKTEILAPGAAETIAVSLNRQDMDAGYLTVATDADNAVKNILSDDPALTCVLAQALKTGSVSAKPQSQTAHYNPGDYPVTAMPTLGADNGLKLFDMIGVPFDDANWQALLDQLTFGDMVCLLADNYAMQQPVSSAQAPGAEIRSGYEMGLPGDHLLAATFHTQLIEDTASAVGNVCLQENVVILQGEAAYSEDAFLAESIYAARTAGLQKKGVLTVAYQTSQSAPEDAVLAGEALAGEWIPLKALELYRFENDPVIVTAMRDACHRNLYALANSAAMNGIGAATTVKINLPWFALVCWIAAPVCLAGYIFFAIMWRRGKKKWKTAEAYLDYRTMKNTLKAEKKK